MAMERVLVTGASGFIALHCIKQLLDAGYHVRGTLRNMTRQDEVRNAVGVKPTTRRVSFIACDLTNDYQWDLAVKDCDYVLHVASPFPASPAPKDEEKLIQTARSGTLRVLGAAKTAGSIKRVVMTSSVAAIASGFDTHIHTEKDWSNPESPRTSAYEKSKIVAEANAWNFSKEKGAPELAVINPGAVLGPLLSPDYSTSGGLVQLLMSRTLKSCPRIGFALVDVRDVAKAHIDAMTVPEAAGRRFICAQDHLWLQDIAKILDAHYGPKGWNIPTRKLPSLLVKTGATVSKSMRRIKPMLGRQWHLDSTQIREVLGWQPRSNEEIIIAMAESMIEHGIVTKP